MRILIVGAGLYGAALGQVLANNGHETEYYDKKFDGQPLEEKVKWAQMILLVVPSNAVTEVLPGLPHELPLIVATKGLLDDKVFEKFKDYMIISGPGFADDILAEKQTKLTITDDRLRQLFGNHYMSFDQTDDKKGVLMCGALKNVYALQAGYEGLERESPEWKKFIQAAAVEMKEILALNGAQAETVDLACGVGDLALTCGMPSRNYEYGNLVRQNPDHQPEKTVEGLSTLKLIAQGDIQVPDSAVILRALIDDNAGIHI